MADAPTRDDLQRALSAAGSAHHEYESKLLGGERDEQWAGFYAAFTLGRLGEFAAPTDLTRWLQAAPPSDDWAATAADHVFAQLDD